LNESHSTIMSSITMAADSTQSDAKRRIKHRTKSVLASRKDIENDHRGCKLKRHKMSNRKMTKMERNNRGSDDVDDSCSDRDSDLDLSKELLPISGYINSGEQMVEHMFRSISMKKLKSMLPEILKPVDLSELKLLCVQQLEGMSKKRICRILDGDDPETISSSGTDEEDVDKGASDYEDEAFDDHLGPPTEREASVDSNMQHAASGEVAQHEQVVECPVAQSQSSLPGRGMEKSMEKDIDTISDSGLLQAGKRQSRSGDKHSEAGLTDGVQRSSGYTVAVDTNKCIDANQLMVKENMSHQTYSWDLNEENQELDYVEDLEDEDKPVEGSDTPSSLPSLESEPEDSCMPLIFPKAERRRKDNDDHSGTTSPTSVTAEANSEPHHSTMLAETSADDHAMACAENENNANIENESVAPGGENHGATEQSVDVNITLVMERPGVGEDNVEELSVSSAASQTQTSTKPARQHSYSSPVQNNDDLRDEIVAELNDIEERVVIELQGHEFSDEEVTTDQALKLKSTQSSTLHERHRRLKRSSVEPVEKTSAVTKQKRRHDSEGHDELAGCGTDHHVIKQQSTDDCALLSVKAKFMKQGAVSLPQNTDTKLQQIQHKVHETFIPVECSSSDGQHKYSVSGKELEYTNRNVPGAETMKLSQSSKNTRDASSLVAQNVICQQQLNHNTTPQHSVARTTVNTGNIVMTDNEASEQNLLKTCGAQVLAASLPSKLNRATDLIKISQEVDSASRPHTAMDDQKQIAVTAQPDDKRTSKTDIAQGVESSTTKTTKSLTKTSEAVLSKTQLEILELEMRARAIKAMLRAQEELEEHEQKQQQVLPRSSSSEPSHQQQIGSAEQPQKSRLASTISVQHREVVVQPPPASRRLVQRTEVLARRKRLVVTQHKLQGMPKPSSSPPMSDSHVTTQPSPRRNVQIKSTVSVSPVTSTQRRVITKSPCVNSSSTRVIRVSPVHTEHSTMFAGRQRTVEHDTVAPCYGHNDMRRVVVSSSAQRFVQVAPLAERQHHYFGSQSFRRQKFRRTGKMHRN
jgi:hypothetical protein